MEQYIKQMRPKHNVINAMLVIVNIVVNQIFVLIVFRANPMFINLVLMELIAMNVQFKIVNYAKPIICVLNAIL